MIVLDWGALTDVGRTRKLNEDAVLAMAPVFLIADGMGGHAAGEVASALAVDVFGALATVDRPLTTAAVLTAIRTANDAIVRAGASSEATAGMGTTAVGLAVVRADGADQLLGFNVGDSRLYRYDGLLGLRQLSTDHSLVQELIDRGDIRPEEARAHPQRNVITRMLGTPEAVEPDTWLLAVAPGDRFLICSDGLTTEVTDDQIAAVLAEHRDPRVVAGRLVEAALAHGGRDNVTVIVVDVSAVDVDDAPVDTSPRNEPAPIDEDTVPRIDPPSLPVAAEPRPTPALIDEVPL